MANTKLSALTALLGASVDTAADLLYIDDVSATTSKKITVSELAAACNTLAHKVGSFTRVMTVASGNVAYTGVGFKPRALIVFANVVNGALSNNSEGFSDGTTNLMVLNYSTTGANASFARTANLIYSFDDVGTANVQSATVASFDADGFTLAWTKQNSPTSTITANYMALR